MNYLVYGEEKYLIDKEINKIINESRINSDSVYKYDMELMDIKELVLKLNTYDLFSSNKIIIAQNSLFLTSKSSNDENIDLLLKYLENPNTSSTLIISVDAKIDERKKITKELKKILNTIKCDKLNDYNIENYIKEEFRQNNYKITNQALFEFINRSSNDLYSINNDIKKIMMYKYEDKIINEEDIKNCISRKIFDDVFLFVDSVIKNDKNLMFQIYKDLVEYHNEEIIKLINLVYGQFRLTYQVTVLKGMNLNEAEIAEKLDVHPYRVKLILKNKSLDTNKLIKYIYQLCKLDLDIKSGKTNKTVAFELFMLSI